MKLSKRFNISLLICVLMIMLSVPVKYYMDHGDLAMSIHTSVQNYEGYSWDAPNYKLSHHWTTLYVIFFEAFVLVILLATFVWQFLDKYPKFMKWLDKQNGDISGGKIFIGQRGLLSYFFKRIRTIMILLAVFAYLMMGMFTLVAFIKLRKDMVSEMYPAIFFLWPLYAVMSLVVVLLNIPTRIGEQLYREIHNDEE